MVGGSTALAIAGDKVAPGLGDWYLARQGYDAQQCDGPADPDRPDNLHEPLPGDRGARGDFGDRAHGGSLQVWLDRHRGWVLAGVGLGLGVALLRKGRRLR